MGRKNKSLMWGSVFSLRFKDSVDQIISIGNSSPVSVSCVPSTGLQPVFLDLLGLESCRPTHFLLRV